MGRLFISTEGQEWHIKKVRRKQDSQSVEVYTHINSSYHTGLITDADCANLEFGSTEPVNVFNVFEELWGANPICSHSIAPSQGGGVKCKICGGWKCF